MTQTQTQKITPLEAACLYRHWKRRGLSGTSLDEAIAMLADILAEQLVADIDNDEIGTIANTAWDKLSE